MAIAGSLGIVGFIALAGAARYARKGLVDWRSVAWFGIPGMVGAYGGAWLSRFVPPTWQLGAFGVVMLVAAFFMLKRRELPESAPRRSAVKIVVDGLVVGVITGLVGVGGGFLIVPALVLLGGLPAHLAVGTSLMIIALKSGAGFTKYIGVLAEQGLRLDWTVIAVFAGVGTIGSLYGGRFAERLKQEQLRRAFGWFVILMAVVILATV